jgi:Protein of unknown function (DUF3667)
MVGEIEAAGAAITAGLAGSVIDGKDPAHAGDGYGACANCGALLDGNFCANCGQPSHIHRSLLHMVEELLHGMFHFDTRAWRMAPYILFRPGTLTRSYVRGKRASYVSPLAMYLLAIFAMFFVFSLIGGSKVGVMTPHRRLEAAEKLADAEAKNLARHEAKVKRLLEAAVSASAEKKAGADADAREAQKDLAETQAAFDSARKALEDRKADDAVATSPDASTVKPALAPAPVTPPAAKVDGGAFAARDGETVYDAIRREAKEGQINVNTGWAYLDHQIEEKAANPELFVYQLQNTAYKYSFLLVPISLPFLWLMFAWKRGLTLFDHAVFILYSLSFVSLLMIILSLLSRAPGLPGWVWPLLVLGIPIHNYFQLKGAYALGWFSALWRTVLLQFVSLTCLIVFLSTIVLVGLVE